jgi:OOP family OmpA-OmpF porin
MRGNTVLTAAMLSTVVLALPSVSMAQAQSPWYVGGSVGQMEAKGSCPAGFTCDFKDSSWKVFGGYQLNRNFAIEGTYLDGGKISVSSGGVTAKGEISSLGVAALGILPLGGDQFSLFGKVGLTATKQKFSASGSGITSTGVEDGSEANWGVGGTFNFNRNLGLRAEWERLDKSEVDIVTIGIQYKF